ncbi:MAG: WD40/YVTN/BNR-like repeat-containing protein [Nannocystaceae bacterium]
MSAASPTEQQPPRSADVGPAEVIQTQPRFQVGMERLNALWSDGTVMLVADNDRVHMTCRDGRQTTSPSLYGASEIHGRGSGDEFEAVAVGRDGKLVTYRGGAWEVARAPMRPGEDLVGVTIDRHGTIFAAGEQTALYEKSGDTWSIHRYPKELDEVHSLAQYSDGRIVLGGSRGVYTYLGKGFSAKKISQSLSRHVNDMWISEDDTLWLITDKQLVSLTKTGAFQIYKTPVFGDLRTIHGVTTPSGDVVVVGGQSEIAFFDGNEFLEASGLDVLPEDLYLDGINEAAYIAQTEGLAHIEFDHPKIVPQAAGFGTCPIPKTAIPNMGILALGNRSLSPTAKVTLTPAAKKSTYRRANRDSMPALRLAFGAAFGKDAEERPDVGFAFDLMGGATLGVAPRLSLFPEIGYGLSRMRENREHLFMAGVGPLWGTEAVAIGVVPRFAIGKSDNQFAIGTRTGLIGSFGMDILAIEVAHQWLRVAGQNVHEGRVMASINVLPLVGFLFLAAALRNVKRNGWRR